jgi:hypothetical protein
VEPEALDQLEARLARLLLEPVARHDAEEHAVAPVAETSHELDRRVRAPRPPAVRDEVEDGERLQRRAPQSASTRSLTRSAEIKRMHG